MSSAMPPKRNRLAWLLGFALLGESIFLFAWLFFGRWKAAGVSPVERGRQVAERYGCFACHGPGGREGLPNPGSEEGSVPAWAGGTAMMYIQNEEEIREWILDGAPARLRESPTYQENRKKRVIQMPAYRGKIPEAELADLIACFKAVSWLAELDEEAAQGREVAFKYGCFGCHGPEGRGSQSNPGSFTGYIPGWDGPGFAELVKSDAELEEWIRDGVSQRFRRNPAAQHFLQRQPLPMPAYGKRLTDKELRSLKAYIHHLRGE
jgi:mono/diheme cytochrome c family protein